MRKALDLDPYLTPAIYKMAMTARFTAIRRNPKDASSNWKKINPDRPDPSPGPGDSAEKKYGEMGKYASVINPFPRTERTAENRARFRRNFEAARPLRGQTCRAGERWVKPSDFTGSRRDRSAAFEPASARPSPRSTPTATDDSISYLASAVVGPKGIHDVLLVEQGRRPVRGCLGRLRPARRSRQPRRRRGRLRRGSPDRPLPHRRRRQSPAPQPGRQDIRGYYVDPQDAGPPALSLMARWLDLDQDGDLDLYVVNYCAAEHADKAFLEPGDAPPGLANTVYRNDGQPDPASGNTVQARTPVATAHGKALSREGLDAGPHPMARGRGAGRRGEGSHRDRRARHRQRPRSRPGAHRREVIAGRPAQRSAGPVPRSCHSSSGCPSSRSPASWRPTSTPTAAPTWWRPVRMGEPWPGATRPSGPPRRRRSPSFESWPINAVNWRAAQALDLDLDGLPDLLGLPATANKPGEVLLPAWARNEGNRFAAETLSLKLPSPGLDGLMAVDLVGDPLPDILVVRPGEPPAVARNLGNGQHWLALQLGGHWRVKPELMRTNSHAIGTRVLVEGQGMHVTYDHTTPESGLAPVDRSGRARPGPPRASHPDPSSLAGRRHAVRAQRRRQSEAFDWPRTTARRAVARYFSRGTASASSASATSWAAAASATWSPPASTASPTATRRSPSRPSSSSRATGSSDSRSPSRWTRSPISIN